jgi:hypothetical protein
MYIGMQNFQIYKIFVVLTHMQLKLHFIKKNLIFSYCFSLIDNTFILFYFEKQNTIIKMQICLYINRKY